MEKSVEEAVINAIAKSLGGLANGREATPSKAYMAISRILPVPGKRYRCERVEQTGKKKLTFLGTETSTVQEARQLSDNMYMVRTRNSYYITRIVELPESKVQFASIREIPKLGTHLKCNKLEFTDSRCFLVPWDSTTIQEIKKICDLYYVRTRNSIYICFMIQ